MKTMLLPTLIAGFTVWFGLGCQESDPDTGEHGSVNNEDRRGRSEVSRMGFVPVPVLQLDGPNPLSDLSEGELLIFANDNRDGKTALRGAEAMHRFLNAWNPVGRSTEELEKKLGDPNGYDGEFSYHFDTGYFGRVIKFEVVGDKVISWSHEGY